MLTRSLRRLSAALLTAVFVVACGGSNENAPSPASNPEPRAEGDPRLRVEVVASGLEHGWEVGFLPDGKILVPQRPGRLDLLSSGQPGATVTRVDADFDDVWVEHETGLMGMLVHPDFAESRRFTTCQSKLEGGRPVDVRLVTWELSQDYRSARRVVDPLLAGLPVDDVTGRHAGCRLRLDSDGALLVGTGDSARNNLAQDRRSLGGKVLRLDLNTGKPWPGNPWFDSENENERYVLTYGHRNVQGIAIQPDSNEVFLAEHGPTVDDEVNLLVRGGNYGWAPRGDDSAAAYDESVPMTDTVRFPDAVRALWSSGSPTEAICAVEFLSGKQWRGLDGALVVTALKGRKILVMRPTRDGEIGKVSVPRELDGTHGRLRAAQLGPDGALYLTTSNGRDDKVLRITPA
ncbi:PQQ-dependent sugar dehydrogenase [Longimycelium tulufanense]|uniref:PQQ-dependent sugar dehydrogenase n=1 Tax=Longimycelium tulufanense TaxID=907463 RepID=UPI00166767CF|nr:PQQ-dependent sugar dehydrogenase [Longimycelium tulufanense]